MVDFDTISDYYGKDNLQLSTGKLIVYPKDRKKLLSILKNNDFQNVHIYNNCNNYKYNYLNLFIISKYKIKRNRVILYFIGYGVGQDDNNIYNRYTRKYKLDRIIRKIE